jgi:hypothetical protein
VDIAMEEARVRDLAGRMLRANAEQPPRTLPVLLGNGCAEAAGVPGYAAMARSTLRRLGSSSSKQGAPPPPPDDTDDALVEWFGRYLMTLGPTQRYKLLEPHYRAVPVPSFYRDLADLAMAGYFTHVLTTNVDSLFEQAMERLGLRNGVDYEVVVLGADRPRLPSSDCRLRLVKLHGDLGETQLPIGPAEIEQVLHEQRSAFRRELLGELVVVGHRLSETREPVDDWLWNAKGEPIWWALPERPPPDGPLAALEAVRPIRAVVGPDRGTPENFFARLSFRLLRLPALQATDVEPEHPDDQALEVAFHRSELLKTRVAVHELAEQRVPGIQDDALVAEIDQQQSRSIQQETQLAAARGTRDAYTEQLRRLLVECVEGIIYDADHSPTKPPALDYLRNQVLLILRQVEVPQPDSRVLKAAVAGVVAFTDTLGDRVSQKTRDNVHAVAKLLESRDPEASSEGLGGGA